jgi:Na+-driven multidrug efflux pump
VKVLLGSTVRLGFNVRVGRGVRLGLSATNLAAVVVGAGGMVGVIICATGVLLAQALSNKEDNKAARANSLKLCFIFILSILLNSFTGIY